MKPTNPRKQLIPTSHKNYTMWFKCFRTEFFKESKIRKEDTQLLMFKIISNCVYTGFCAVVVYENLPNFSLFVPALVHQLQLLGSQQHPQSGVLLISFSTWGTENSLADINLEIMGV
jgi:hypothetical protein